MNPAKTAHWEQFIPNPKARLHEQVHEVMRFYHYSFRTEEAYWQWIRRFIFFHNKRHPKDMGSVEVSAFLFGPSRSFWDIKTWRRLKSTRT